MLNQQVSVAGAVNPAAINMSGSAPAAHSCRHYCTAEPVRPLPDKYALVTGERTNKQMNRQKDISIGQGFAAVD